jgi:hypothetical protein
VEGLSAYYADTANFYGTNTSRSKIMDEKRKFSMRWPNRSYTVKMDTLVTQCTDGCSVSGIVDWDASSTERNEHSTGSAVFVLKIAPNGLIVSENGAVKSSHKQPLTTQTSESVSARYQFDSGCPSF